MCGCGKQAGSTAQWTVTPRDGTAIKSFDNKPAADVYAARTGGIVRQTST